MKIGICSFALHRTVASGILDFNGIARTCRELGCTQIDPWNAHLLEPASRADGLHAGTHPHDARLGTPGDEHIELVASEAAEAGLPFGCIAVDGAHLLEKDTATELLHRERARRWIEIAGMLRADAVRIDCGGPETLDGAILSRISEGYRELIALAAEKKLRVLIENHWGPSVVPDNVERILDACPGLGFLFDTNNWKPGLQQEGWRRCAKRADVVHVKTFAFDTHGDETTLDLSPAFAHLRKSGFQGSWCVESVPTDGDEITAARKTIALIRRYALQQVVA